MMNFFQTKNTKEQPSNLDLNAGAELLLSFQAQWENIHSNSFQATTNAKEVSKLLQQSAIVWKRNVDMFNRLHSHLQMLPNLADDIDKLTSAIGRCGDSIEEVTSSIEFYEKISREYKNCKDQKYDLQEINSLRIVKRQELERMKEALAGKHAALLSQVQAQQTELTEKRQETLEEAIDFDLPI